jgi:hypothetical protein
MRTGALSNLLLRQQQQPAHQDLWPPSFPAAASSNISNALFDNPNSTFASTLRPAPTTGFNDAFLLHQYLLAQQQQEARLSLPTRAIDDEEAKPTATEIAPGKVRNSSPEDSKPKAKKTRRKI